MAEKKQVNQCIYDDQKEFLETMLKMKIEILEEELENETELFEKTGFYSNRDTEEIEKELKTAKNVLKNIDDLPKCKKQ